ncbi:MAG: hypothetical protein EOO41_02810, partial [Methanobacteriota archaeon]
MASAWVVGAGLNLAAMSLFGLKLRRGGRTSAVLALEPLPASSIVRAEELRMSRGPKSAFESDKPMCTGSSHACMADAEAECEPLSRWDRDLRRYATYASLCCCCACSAPIVSVYLLRDDTSNSDNPFMAATSAQLGGRNLAVRSALGATSAVLLASAASPDGRVAS